VELRRLIRQRSRWFQGHLQSWRLIPRVLRSAPRRARTDVLYHLSSPAILLIASLLTASFLLALANCAVIATQGRDPIGWWAVSTYALIFGPAMVFGYVYWIRERGSGVPLIQAAWFAHLYVCYCLIWYVAGWWAVARTVRGSTAWSKTDRVAETPAGRPPARRQPVQRPVRRPVARRPLGRPNWVRPAAAAMATALVAAAIGATALWSAAGNGQLSAKREWLTVFNGYGSTAVAGTGVEPAVTLSSGRVTSRRGTHAALVVSRATYRDLSAGVGVHTTEQLRRGAAGRPNPWEVGWVVWHYTSNQRFYALALEPAGWVLSKQDPAYPGGERFLASGKFPRFPVGVTHSARIVQIGNQITVSGDGRVLAQFTDKQRPYLSGKFGLYVEDSRARFEPILLAPAVTASQGPARLKATANPAPLVVARRPTPLR
jgi:hypothetical protein